jgi:hypothetical protein
MSQPHLKFNNTDLGGFWGFKLPVSLRFLPQLGEEQRTLGSQEVPGGPGSCSRAGSLPPFPLPGGPQGPRARAERRGAARPGDSALAAPEGGRHLQRNPCFRGSNLRVRQLPHTQRDFRGLAQDPLRSSLPPTLSRRALLQAGPSSLPLGSGV